MILDEIAAKTRERIAEEKKKVSLSALKSLAAEQDTDSGFPFEKALKGSEISFICEVKKASPSKGLIAADFPYVEIAREYEEAGAHAISVLTEPYYFQGNNFYLQEIKKSVSLPVLRKDFTVDEYMIYEAKVIGADAILLICTILSEEQLKEYVQIGESLGLSVLVEAHDRQEIQMALAARASIIGVNNRNLKDFTVDINNSIRLRPFVPDSVLFVSESGMKTGEDIQKLRENGTDAVLIGETLMKSRDKKAVLCDLAEGKRKVM